MRRYFVGALGTYDLSFTPVGLPSGSSYTFTFDGTQYSATAPASVSVPSIQTGEYPLANVSATSTTPGYVDFAPSTLSEIEVPVETNILLNFSTEVDATGTLGVATFVATGLANGDFWQVAFNGTTYGSTTPWINVTTHPGTFGVGSFPITDSANDTTAYTANTFGPSLSVTPGTSYPVNFSLSYRVDVSSSVGGSATGSGSHWLTPGSLASFSATASPNFRFLGWAGGGAGSYTGTSMYANITVNGPISETATFAGLSANRYNLTLSEVGLPAGTWWTVSLNGTGYSSEATTFQVDNLYSCNAGASGQYPVAVPFVYLNGTAGVRYVATGYPSSACTDGVTTVMIVFHAEYLVTTYTAGGGTATLSVVGEPTSTSAWVSAGTPFSIEATPASGNVFAGWLGTGPGNYTGPMSTQDVVPTGTVTEVATFQAAPVPVRPGLYALLPARDDLGGRYLLVGRLQRHGIHVDLWLDQRIRARSFDVLAFGGNDLLSRPDGGVCDALPAEQRGPDGQPHVHARLFDLILGVGRRFVGRLPRPRTVRVLRVGEHGELGGYSGSRLLVRRMGRHRDGCVQRLGRQHERDRFRNVR